MVVVYNLTPANALQSLQDEGLDALGLTAPMLSPVWSGMNPTLDLAAMTMTFGMAPNAPFRGILDFLPFAPAYREVTGAPITGQAAVLRLHPQAAARLSRIAASRYQLGANPQVRVVPDMRTCTHLSLLKPDGELAVGVTDFEILKHLDSDYLRQHEHLIADADMLVIDSTLSEDALATVFELADRYYVRVCADPTTPLLASRLRPYLNQLHLIVPNAGETAALCDLLTPVADREAALAAARHLATEGVYIAVVTMGAGGLAYAGEGGAGYIRAVHTHVVDPTGAGDALTGAVIFGLLNDVPLDEAMRLGVTAAALTLQTDETVAPELTQEVLYDRLMA